MLAAAGEDETAADTASGAAGGELAPPPSAPFPLPLRDAFDAADAIDRAPRFFADMIGSFALARSSSAAAVRERKRCALVPHG
jgi:hypothetical protein